MQHHAIVQAPNIDDPVKRFGDKHKLTKPQLWPEFKWAEIKSLTLGSNLNRYGINPALNRRKLYLYVYMYNASLGGDLVGQLNVRWDEQNLLSFPINTFNAANTGASFPMLPVSGGNVVADTIQLVIGGALTAEPATALLQPFYIDVVANNVNFDVTSSPGAGTIYRVWSGCFSY